MPRRKGQTWSDDERGSGIVASLFGAVVFLAFLLLATNTLVGLYATSVTSAVAYDAARSVANANGDPLVVASSEQTVRTKLSSLENLGLEWQAANDQIGLRVTAQRPSFLPPSLLAGTRLTTIDRTVWVRAEAVR